MTQALVLRRRPVGVAMALLVGFAWGVFCWAADDSPWMVLRAAANLGAPWLLIAFGCGALLAPRSVVSGMLCGAASLLAAVTAYYVSIELFDPEAPFRASQRAGGVWAAIALPAGAFFGAAGSAPPQYRVASIALVGAALVGEGLLRIEELHLYQGTPDSLQIWGLGQIGVAAALPFIVLRSARGRTLALLLMLILGFVGLLAQEALLSSVDDYLRPAGT